MGRKPKWVAPDGNTTEAIGGVLVKNIHKIVALGSKIYTATTMQFGWDNAQLEYLDGGPERAFSAGPAGRTL